MLASSLKTQAVNVTHTQQASRRSRTGVSGTDLHMISSHLSWTRFTSLSVLSPKKGKEWTERWIDFSYCAFVYPFFIIIIIIIIIVVVVIIIYPLTTGVVWAPQMILHPVSSIFPCSPLPYGTWRTQGLSIPWCCLPTMSHRNPISEHKIAAIRERGEREREREREWERERETTARF